MTCPQRSITSRQEMAAQTGQHQTQAMARRHIVEMKSPFILRPGPAALTSWPDALIAALCPKDVPA